ncbi:MAG: nuclear transport factor 2 family protein [Candidatus Eremiobacteraeota bacterium]|nr:nuclear transport factor 2 family protein [Candidatus Eremiobacteraeota bacterium]MBV8222218.1 nuclear transport factor 2 family protein [Candidatus Eremiobacteraeota bacterium]MBV8280819.1 nuclear transport factor 2 family protein [Candidatus Eremiobacteraeota bacterium]
MTALVLSLAIAAASPTPSAVQAHIAQARAAIDAGNAVYISTWQHADAAGFAALYTDSADSIGDDGSITHGRAAIQAAQAESFARSPLLRGTITTEDLVVDGPTAYEMGRYSFTLNGKNGTPVTINGRYLTIWSQQADGTWKISTDAGLTDRVCTPRTT